MINEKPYIEYNGEKYEFEANFTLKREYDKEIQNEYQKSLSKALKNKEDLNSF